MSDKGNQKVEELTTDSKNGFSFEVKPILQLNLLEDIKKFEDFSCKITFEFFLGQTKRNIYIQNCEFNNQEKPLFTSTKTDPLCHNCHKYGHTKTRCRLKAVCRNCGEDDHTNDKTNKCPNESKCANCGEGHMTRRNILEVEIK